MARSTDPAVVARATDGGVVTALLLHLFDRGRIDGAIVAKQVGPFQRAPYLATSREEILEAAGFFFDTSHGLKQFSDQYLTFSSIEEVRYGDNPSFVSEALALVHEWSARKKKRALHNRRSPTKQPVTIKD